MKLMARAVLSGLIGLTAACASGGGVPAAVPPSTTATAAASAAPPEPKTQTESAATFGSGDEVQFTEACARILRDLDPTMEVEVAQPLELSIRTSRRQLGLNLHRVWTYCSHNGGDCESATRSYLERTVDEIATRFGPPEMRQVRAVIREGTYPGAVADPLVTGLWILYAVDTPNATQILTTSQLEALGVDAERLRAVARENVLQDLGPLAEHVQVLPDDGIGYIQTGNYYVSSYLLDVSAWKVVADPMRGRLLVAAPTRDMVVYADSASPRIDQVLPSILKDFMRRSPIPLSDVVLAWSPEGWSVWDGGP